MIISWLASKKRFLSFWFQRKQNALRAHLYPFKKSLAGERRLFALYKGISISNKQKGYHLSKLFLAEKRCGLFYQPHVLKFVGSSPTSVKTLSSSHIIFFPAIFSNKRTGKRNKRYQTWKSLLRRTLFSLFSLRKRKKGHLMSNIYY